MFCTHPPPLVPLLRKVNLTHSVGHGKSFKFKKNNKSLGVGLVVCAKEKPKKKKIAGDEKTCLFFPAPKRHAFWHTFATNYFDRSHEKNKIRRRMLNSCGVIWGKMQKKKIGLNRWLSNKVTIYRTVSGESRSGELSLTLNFGDIDERSKLETCDGIK